MQGGKKKSVAQPVILLLKTNYNERCISFLPLLFFKKKEHDKCYSYSKTKHVEIILLRISDNFWVGASIAQWTLKVQGYFCLFVWLVVMERVRKLKSCIPEEKHNILKIKCQSCEWMKRFRFIDKDQSLKHFQTGTYLVFVFKSHIICSYSWNVDNVPKHEEIDSRTFTYRFS